jgi:hypothetical protein
MDNRLSINLFDSLENSLFKLFFRINTHMF